MMAQVTKLCLVLKVVIGISKLVRQEFKKGWNFHTRMKVLKGMILHFLTFLISEWNKMQNLLFLTDKFLQELKYFFFNFSKGFFNKFYQQIAVVFIGFPHNRLFQ